LNNHTDGKGEVSLSSENHHDGGGEEEKKNKKADSSNTRRFGAGSGRGDAADGGMSSALRFTGICYQCGRKTHNIFRFPVFSKDVCWNGVCTHCHPIEAPSNTIVSPGPCRDISARVTGVSTAEGLIQSPSKKADSGTTLEPSSPRFPRQPKIAKMGVSKSARNLASESWGLVQDDLQSLGIDFFLKHF
jgi:hypothetical protein